MSRLRILTSPTTLATRHATTHIVSYPRCRLCAQELVTFNGETCKRCKEVEDNVAAMAADQEAARILWRALVIVGALFAGWVALVMRGGY